MSKTIISTSKNGKRGKSAKNGHVPILPDALTPSVVKAVLEDAVQTAAADEAALAASDPDRVPYLGETRRQALALAGLRTRQDLEQATVAQIGGVKGVGMGNAARVKAWLAREAKSPAVAAATPVLLLDNSVSALAAANQEVQDVFQKLETAAARLKGAPPTKGREKALGRQLLKLDTVASELAEGPDTLSVKQVEKAVKTLDKIAALLAEAADAEKLSPKKKSVLIEELRARRKRLQKTLGD